MLFFSFLVIEEEKKGKHDSNKADAIYGDFVNPVLNFGGKIFLDQGIQKWNAAIQSKNTKAEHAFDPEFSAGKNLHLTFKARPNAHRTQIRKTVEEQVSNEFLPSA